MSSLNAPSVAPASGDDWIALSDGSLPVAAASEWVVLPNCGASVVFTGTTRDHAPGRDGVTSLDYEAYDSHALRRLAAVAAEARRRWSDLGRVALLHRTGTVAVGEASVVVAVSSPHRADAFDAARWCIDTLKETVPIWKQEAWAGGRDWVLDGAAEIRDVAPREAGAAAGARP